VATGGLVVLVVGWWLGVEGVTRVLPGLVSMKANTALGFVLAGLAIAPFVRHRAPRFADGLGALLALLGGATVLQYATGADLGIDQLLAADPGLVATASPGRMGLNSALGFLPTGLAAPLVPAGRGRTARVVGQTLTFGVLLLSSLALLGYVLGAESAVGLGSATKMALHTSVLFVVHALGALAITADTGLLAPLVSGREAGRTARRVLPALVAGVLAAVLLIQVLVWTGLVADPQLEIALLATLSLTASGVVVLFVVRSLARSDAVAVTVTRELEAVRSAFRDLHLRVAEDDRILALHGPAGDYGLPPTDAGQPIGDVFPLDALPELRQALVRSRGGEGRQTITFSTPDGDATHQVQLVQLGDGDVGIAVRDVSDLARTQRELAELAASLEVQVAARTAELARTNRELERFAHVASHDLRTSLTSIVGFAETLLQYPDMDDKQRQSLLQRIADAGHGMSQMVAGMLRLAESAGEHREPVDLNDVVGWVQPLVRGSLEGAGGSMEVRDLHTVWGNEPALRTVVLNLVTNAVKYRSPDRTLRLAVWSRQVEGRVELVVEDNGIGIPPGERDAVFEFGYRLGTAVAEDGIGLGLSAVRRILEQLDGSVEFDDTETGESVRVLVSLPAADARWQSCAG
jgi:signal transduction histidine kinase